MKETQEEMQKTEEAKKKFLEEFMRFAQELSKRKKEYRLPERAYEKFFGSGIPHSPPVLGSKGCVCKMCGRIVRTVRVIVFDEGRRALQLCEDCYKEWKAQNEKK